MKSFRVIEADLPEFGMPDSRPELPQGLYAARLDRLRARAKAAGLSTIIVYGDREHFANMAYFLDFEPRFEEALLVVSEGHVPLVITGPENSGRAHVAKVEVEVATYPTFGLLGQKRQGTPPLADLLRSRGIGRGSTVGIAGWKYFTRDPPRRRPYGSYRR